MMLAAVLSWYKVGVPTSNWDQVMAPATVVAVPDVRVEVQPVEEVWRPVTNAEPVASDSPRQAEQIFARMKQIIHEQHAEIAAAQAELAALRQGGARHDVAQR